MFRVMTRYLVVTSLLAQLACAASFAARVVGVADGDTITVLHDQKPIRIRLAGVDAPERRQAWGNRARQFTAAACFNRTVTVHERDRDQFGRVVADIILPDGQNLGDALVANGLAWHYRRYSSSMRLAALEHKARDARRGLWAEPNPVPPWEFRRTARNPPRTSALRIR